MSGSWAQSHKTLTCWIWHYLQVVSELSLNVGHQAGVAELFGVGKKITHLVIWSESSAVSWQKTEEYFFPKQALKRSKSEMPEAVVVKP